MPMLVAAVKKAPSRGDHPRAAPQATWGAGRERLTVTRVCLRVDEAAWALGVSADCFREHIKPDLKTILVGKGTRRIELIPVAELTRWIESHATRLLDEFERRTGNR